MRETDVLIIGGGISGLSTAWWLARQGISTEVWEADDRAGGKIRTTADQGYLTERAAGLLVNYHPEVDQLIQQCGLEEHKQTRDESLKRYIIRHNRLTAVPMKLPDLMASPLWSRKAKLRLAAEIFIQRGRDESETVSSFISRRLGREILETVIDPFIAGTLASDPDKAEARAVLPRLTKLEQRYGSLTMGMLINAVLKRRRANKADTFSFRSGMSQLTDTLARTEGIELHLGLKVSTIRRDQDGWQVTAKTADGKRSVLVRQLVLSTPADSAAKLLSDTDEKLAGLLTEIEYSPVGVLHLGLAERGINQPLDGTGFLVSTKNHLPFNGNLWMSRLFPGRAPKGQALLSTYLGGALHPEQLQQSDEKIVSLVLEKLKPLLSISSDPDYVRMDRHEKGLPLYHGQYQQRLETIGEHLDLLPGLHLNANYMGGVAVRERIFQGKRTAQTIARVLANRLQTTPMQQPFAIAQ
ncbi:MAG: protoporphyrinogen oxidase [Pseudomonadota bacterium]